MQENLDHYISKTIHHFYRKRLIYPILSLLFAAVLFGTLPILSVLFPTKLYRIYEKFFPPYHWLLLLYRKQKPKGMLYYPFIAEYMRTRPA